MEKKEFCLYFGKLNKCNEMIRTVRVARYYYQLYIKDGKIESKDSQVPDCVFSGLYQNELYNYLNLFENIKESKIHCLEFISQEMDRCKDRVDILENIQEEKEEKRINRVRKFAQKYPDTWFYHLCDIRLRSPNMDIVASAVYVMENLKKEFSNNFKKALEFLEKWECENALNDYYYDFFGKCLNITLTGQDRRLPEKRVINLKFNDASMDPVEKLVLKMEKKDNYESFCSRLFVGAALVEFSDIGKRIVHACMYEPPLHHEGKATVYVDKKGTSKILQDCRKVGKGKEAFFVYNRKTFKKFMEYSIRNEFANALGDIKIIDCIEQFEPEGFIPDVLNI